MMILDPRSAVVRLAVELYQAHMADRHGWCVVCRERLCPVRRNSAEVIRAAGLDPARFGPPPATAFSEATAELPQLLPRREPGSALERETREAGSRVEWCGT